MVDDNQKFAETASDFATKIQYSGSGAAVFFGLTLNELGALIGIIVAIGGFAVNVYYKHKTHVLLEQKHKLELELLKGAKK